MIRENKNFLDKDLIKNIYISNKNHLINLNILNFAINPKYKIKDFSITLRNILRSKEHTFPIDGKFLIRQGMKESLKLGMVLKKIEDEWINNGFKISKDRVKEIIKSH